MSARVLLSGVLQKLPVRKTSKAGKPYLMASARDGNGPDAKWWAIFAFNEEAVEALEALTVGEAFAATGSFEATIWAPEGREPRVNMTLNADAILSAHKPKAKAKEGKSREPKEAAPAAAPEQRPGRSIPSKSSPEPISVGGIPFDDSIPFFPEWR
jgi:hypothetical protein